MSNVAGNEKKRRITRTALLLGVLALVVYGGYIALFVVSGGAS